MSGGAGEVLARFAHDYRIEDAAGAADEAGGYIIDALAAGSLAAAHPIARQVRAVLAGEARPGRHAVIGQPDRVRPGWAAWANGVLMHAEDFDDTPHTTYFLPALLTVAEQRPITGRELLGCWAMSYELWMTLVDALRLTRPFNPTSVVGPVVAAAGVARLRGLDADGIRRAMAVAASSSGGLRGQFGTDMKALDAGRSARAGVEAVDLTLAGWTADPDILDRPNGWLASFGSDARLAVRVPTAAGAPFPRIGRPPRAKAWPCCARHAGVLGALLPAVTGLGQDRQGVDRVDVEVGFDPDQTAVFRAVPRTPLEAKFSIPYVVTAACLDGEITSATFEDEAFRRITSAPLFERVLVRFVPERQGPEGKETTAAHLRLSDGTTVSAETVGGAWLDRAGITRKFLDSAGVLLGDEAAAALLAQLEHLEDVADVGALIGRFGAAGIDHRSGGESE